MPNTMAQSAARPSQPQFGSLGPIALKFFDIPICVAGVPMLACTTQETSLRGGCQTHFFCQAIGPARFAPLFFVISSPGAPTLMPLLTATLRPVFPNGCKKRT